MPILRPCKFCLPSLFSKVGALIVWMSRVRFYIRPYRHPMRYGSIHQSSLGSLLSQKVLSSRVSFYSGCVKRQSSSTSFLLKGKNSELGTTLPNEYIFNGNEEKPAGLSISRWHNPDSKAIQWETHWACWYVQYLVDRRLIATFAPIVIQDSADLRRHYRKPEPSVTQSYRVASHPGDKHPTRSGYRRLDARKLSDPLVSHWKAMKDVVWYLIGKVD